MKKLVFPIIIALISLTTYGQDSGLINDFKLDRERSFIQNEGQFDGRNWQQNKIVYAMDNNPFYIFFTKKGVTYRFDKIIKNPNRESEHEEGGDKPKRVNISELVHATWIDANEDVEIIAEKPVDFYYSYAVKDFATDEVSNLQGINGYQKITYKNLYDNIDVEYTIHPKGGIKYSVILHQGADPSQLKLKYRTVHTNTKDEKINLNLNEEGQLKISTSLGEIIEHAPFTYYKDNEVEVESEYNFENNILSFQLGDYDKSKEVIIDPWVLSPNFSTSTAVWEVETDGTGNVYVIGGETPMELRKYDAAGTQQWIYVTPWDTNSVWLGTMATDDAGTSFITSGTSPEIERVDNAGNMIWHQNGSGLSNEYWSITFNCDNTKLLVGGTYVPGIFSFDYSAAIYDIDVNSGAVNNFVTLDTTNISAIGATPVEVRSISSSKNAKYIYLTHHDVGAINQNIGACPNDLPIYHVDNDHNLAYKCENYLPETQNGGGLKALVANDQYFYTHDGDQVYQRDLNNGALLNTAAIPGGGSATDLFGDIVVHNSGLDVDDCGNVYVGSNDRVVKYDPNLNYVSEATTNFAVYDVSVNANGEVLAVGAELDNSNANRTGHIASVNLTACAQYALICCDANVCIPDTLCETDAPINLIPSTGGGTFSGTGITDATAGTFDPSVAGAGTHTITYTLPCGSDQIEVVVDPCASLDACVETNGDITITTGDGNNTWEEWTTISTTSNDCATCGGTLVFGICTVTLPCTITTTGWNTFATGTSTETPTGNWPVQVTDGTGMTITINDPANLPACATTCDPTITPAGPFCETDAAVNLTAAETGGTWSGTGITDATAGTFDPATAGAGTHTITYSLACGSMDTEDIIVNPTDDASFSYAQATYCTTDTDPTPTITGLTGGSFTIDNAGVINTSTGAIDLDASGAGSYVVTYTTNGPCPNSATFNITITTNADATISAAGPFCETDAAVNLSAVDGGGTWSGTGITDATAGTFDPSVAGAGTHTITYEITGSCGDIDTEDIVVNPSDDPSFSYAQGSYCLTDANPIPTITGLSGGTFTIDNAGVINASTGEIDIAASGAGSYTVTYTTNGPCPESATFAITLTTGADATITPAGPFCETDAAVNLSAVDGGGTWSGTGITDATAGTFDPSVAGAGTHTITYEITGSCGDIDTEDIVVNPSDDPSFSYAQGSYCLTDANPIPIITGLSGGTFTIDNAGVVNASTGEIDIAASGAGSYTVTYTTNGPCPESATFAITLTTGADATITPAGPFCQTDAAVNLSAVDGGGTWSGTGITDATAGTFDPSLAGAGTHTITYEITGSCGDIDTEDIVVNPSDDPSFSYTQGSYCLTDANPTPTITGLPGGTFTIDNAGVINASTGEIDIAASGAGSYTVTYTTNGPCPESATFAITLTTGADATITPAGPFCETDAAVNLSAVDAGGTWSGTGITDATAGIFDPSVAGAGTHTITYEITGSCGDIDTEDIVVNPIDDASFSYATASFCISDPDPTPTISGLSGGTFTIDNSGVIDSNTGSIDLDVTGSGTYQVTYTTNGPCPNSTVVNVTITNSLDATISSAGPLCENDPAVILSAVDGGGTWTGNGITDPNAGTFDPSVAGAGTHTITYTIGGACGSTDNIDIVVNPADVASFSYPSTSFCSNEFDPSPGITGTLGGSFSIDNGGVINPTTGMIDLDQSGAGNYTVTYITSGACPDTASQTLTINSAIYANIDSLGALCIYDNTINLDASPAGGIWSGNGITDSINGTFNPDSSGIGLHEVIYEVTGTCGDSDTINIQVNGAPTAVTDPSVTVNYGSSVTLNASGGGTYTWIPDDNLSCSNCADPEANPLENTTYCVVVVDSGCVDTACTDVIVNLDFDCADVFVPTAFTPSSGDENRYECVLGGCITEMHFRIYNRWGELLFESFDQNICWDGTHKRNGKPVSSGVYVYMLDAKMLNGEEVELKGNISLIR